MNNFDWRKYLSLARELSENRPISDQEAKHRTIISRAYYAALMVARNYVEDTLWGLRCPVDRDQAKKEKKSTHDLIIDRIFEEGENTGDRNIKEVADFLRKLRTKRNSADYDPWYRQGQADVRKEADESLKQAGDVIAKIDAIKTPKTDPGPQAP